MKKQEAKQHEVKTDLRHDTMEFSASTDGDDKLDLDDFSRDDDGISGEELDYLEENNDAMTAALSAVESDRLSDSDNLPEEDDEDDYYDDDKPREGELESRV